jgi:hypothetical protein
LCSQQGASLSGATRFAQRTTWCTASLAGSSVTAPASSDCLARGLSGLGGGEGLVLLCTLLVVSSCCCQRLSQSCGSSDRHCKCTQLQLFRWQAILLQRATGLGVLKQCLAHAPHDSAASAVMDWCKKARVQRSSATCFEKQQALPVYQACCCT